jgi:hypothetical protein
VKTTVFWEHVFFARQEAVQWLQHAKDVNIHHGRTVIHLIVTGVEAMFTSMVAAKAPERVDIETVVHGTASKLVVPGANTGVGVVEAGKRRQQQTGR